MAIELYNLKDDSFFSPFEVHKKKFKEKASSIIKSLDEFRFYFFKSLNPVRYSFRGVVLWLNALEKNIQIIEGLKLLNAIDKPFSLISDLKTAREISNDVKISARFNDFEGVALGTLKFTSTLSNAVDSTFIFLGAIAKIVGRVFPTIAIIDLVTLIPATTARVVTLFRTDEFLNSLESEVGSAQVTGQKVAHFAKKFFVLSEYEKVKVKSEEQEKLLKRKELRLIRATDASVSEDLKRIYDLSKNLNGQGKEVETGLKAGVDKIKEGVKRLRTIQRWHIVSNIINLIGIAMLLFSPVTYVPFIFLTIGSSMKFAVLLSTKAEAPK